MRIFTHIKHSLKWMPVGGNLLVAARNNSMAACSERELGELLDRHAAGLSLYARQWTRSADDVVQEAFVALLRLAERPARPGAWLFGTVRRRALMAARAQRRRARHEFGAAAAESWFEATGETQLDGEAATAALRELAEDERETVIAHLWGRLTFEEIGNLQGCSAATAHRRYTAALERLRQRLDVTWHTKD